MRVTRRAVAGRRVPEAREPFDGVLERCAAAAERGPGGRGREPVLPELREVARAVPAAIWAGQVAGRGPLVLGFGRDLSVELRQAPGGIEVTIRAAPALERAARVDLPALVAALAGHGVAVLRAEVRADAPVAGERAGRSASR